MSVRPVHRHDGGVIKLDYSGDNVGHDDVGGRKKLRLIATDMCFHAKRNLKVNGGQLVAKGSFSHPLYALYVLFDCQHSLLLLHYDEAKIANSMLLRWNFLLQCCM